MSKLLIKPFGVADGCALRRVFGVDERYTENQGVYPHSNQRVGCGFPIAKIVVMFSLVTGTLMAGLIEAFNTSELVMARQLIAC